MLLLDPVEVRVLGALIEKEATTPEYYPLSLNALVNACNQKSNRNPVVDYDERDVTDALEGLRQKGLALIVEGNGRVKKFAQRISETLNLGRRELGVLCVLFLRGPQTLGEIKDRSERVFAFADLDETSRVLDKLAEMPSGAMVTKLPRQPGQKESRYLHLLSGEPTADIMEGSLTASPLSKSGQVEQQIADLQDQVNDLQKRLAALEAAFR